MDPLEPLAQDRQPAPRASDALEAPGEDAAAGFPRDGGPIPANPMDHGAGHAHLGVMAERAGQALPWDEPMARFDRECASVGQRRVAAGADAPRDPGRALAARHASEP